MYKWFKFLLYTTPMVGMTATIITDFTINTNNRFDISEILNSDDILKNIKIDKESFKNDLTNKSSNLQETIKKGLMKNYSSIYSEDLEIKYYYGSVTKSQLSQDFEINKLEVKFKDSKEYDDQIKIKDILNFSVIINSYSSKYVGRAILNFDFRPMLPDYIFDGLFMDSTSIVKKSNLSWQKDIETQFNNVINSNIYSKYLEKYYKILNINLDFSYWKNFKINIEGEDLKAIEEKLKQPDDFIEIKNDKISIYESLFFDLTQETLASFVSINKVATFKLANFVDVDKDGAMVKEKKLDILPPSPEEFNNLNIKSLKSNSSIQSIIKKAWNSEQETHAEDENNDWKNIKFNDFELEFYGTNSTGAEQIVDDWNVESVKKDFENNKCIYSSGPETQTCGDVNINQKDLPNDGEDGDDEELPIETSRDAYYIYYKIKSSDDMRIIYNNNSFYRIVIFVDEVQNNG